MDAEPSTAGMTSQQNIMVRNRPVTIVNAVATHSNISSRCTEHTSAWRPCRFLLMSDMVAMRPAGCGVSELIAGPGC